jgi:hypothetical protein
MDRAADPRDTDNTASVGRTPKPKANRPGTTLWWADGYDKSRRIDSTPGRLRGPRRHRPLWRASSLGSASTAGSTV